MANATSESLKTSCDNEGERIFIPFALRGQLIKNFPLSVRLANVLGQKNINLVGELHGINYAEFAKWRNCGRKTVLELQNLVRQLQSGSSDIAVREQDSHTEAKAGHRFVSVEDVTSTLKCDKT